MFMKSIQSWQTDRCGLQFQINISHNLEAFIKHNFAILIIKDSERYLLTH